jgi:hypothetical protein
MRPLLVALAMLLPLAAGAVDVVTFDGYDQWYYGFTHLSDAEVDTLDPGFTPDLWWVQVDSVDVSVWCYPSSGDTALSPVGNTLKIEDGEGVNFNTSVDWVKVEALSGQAGQLRWFFVGHSE